MKYAALGDTVYFWFAANLVTGAAGDGSSPTFAVRKAGASSSAAPTLTGSPTLLSHASYSDGSHEIAVAATSGNGFVADAEYAVFCSLTISSINPNGFVGSFKLTGEPTLSAIAGAVNELLSDDHGAGSWESGGAATGANAITSHVTDGSNDVEGAKIRFSKPGTTNPPVITDADGLATTGLDDATWNVVITAVGFDPLVTTLIVNGAESPEFTLTPRTITPSEPGTVTGATTSLNNAGAPAGGIKLTARQISRTTGLGVSGSAQDRVVISAANGVVEFTGLLPGARYRVWRGDDVEKGVVVDVPNDDFTIPDLFGSP